MKRIWIMGSSGSGKTTLGAALEKKLGIPLYHNNKIFWEKNWKDRSNEEQIQMTQHITSQDQWIYEGNRFNDSKKGWSL